MENRTYHIPAISCEGCVRAIRSELNQLEGVQVLAADTDTRNVTVAWSAPATEAAIVDLLKEIEYEPAPA